MKSIITPKDTEHHIRAYNFRVLTKDILEATKDGREIEFEPEPEPAPPPPPPPPPPAAAAAPAAAAPAPETAPVQVPVIDEKLLGKLDELSDRVIKLQMQLEKQEAEFEKRLAEQLDAAKSAAFAEGKAAAASEAEGEINRLRSNISAAGEKLSAAAAAFDENLKRASAELKEMALMIAREVINKELALNSAAIAASYAASLIAQLDKEARARVMVHPGDYEQVRAAIANERISVHADEAIAPGCLMLQSDSLNSKIDLKDRFAAARALLESQ